MIFILVLLSSSWAVSSRTVTVGYLLHAEDYLMALRGAVCFVTGGQAGCTRPLPCGEHIPCAGSVLDYRDSPGSWPDPSCGTCLAVAP